MTEQVRTIAVEAVLQALADPSSRLSRLLEARITDLAARVAMAWRLPASETVEEELVPIRVSGGDVEFHPLEIAAIREIIRSATPEPS